MIAARNEAFRLADERQWARASAKRMKANIMHLKKS